jgi:Uma2 family endonuclease
MENMSTGPSLGRPATLEDWLAQLDDGHAEFIDGQLIEKASPAVEHGVAQLRLGIRLAEFSRRGGGGRPGGWWLASEVDILLDGRGYRPDIAGWRRERMPVLPRERPMTVRPDWVCEIVSESNRMTDTVIKLRRFHQVGIPHYWILDQAARTLTVYRHTLDGYLVALASEAGERIRAEPFDAIELSVSDLLGDDPEE